MKSKGKYSDVPIRIKSWGYIIVIFILMLISPLSMNIIMTLLTIYSTYEYFRMIGINKKSLLVCNSLLYIILFFILNKNDYHLFFIASVIYIAIGIITSIGIFKLSQKKIRLLTLGAFICFFCLNHLPFIRTLSITEESQSGVKLTIFVVVITELNDVFQYLTGKIFGKKKIAPKISPNKTIEGFLGGVILSAILSTFLGLFLLPRHNLFINFILGSSIAVLGFWGDLMMSYIKRKSKVKDTGNLIPGHGGLLDRLDSLILVLPVFYLFCIKLYS